MFDSLAVYKGGLLLGKQFPLLWRATVLFSSFEQEKEKVMLTQRVG